MPPLGQISEFYVAESTHGLGSILSGNGQSRSQCQGFHCWAHIVQLPWELQAGRAQVLC